MKTEFNTVMEIRSTAAARLTRVVVGGVPCPVGSVLINTKIGEVSVLASPVTAGGGFKKPHSKFTFYMGGVKYSAKQMAKLLA